MLKQGTIWIALWHKTQRNLLILPKLTEQRALYGPTGLMQTGGPCGKGTLNPHAYDKAVMEKLWQASEKATDFSWGI